MENHHVQWVNPLFLWPFSIANCLFHDSPVVETTLTKPAPGTAITRTLPMFFRRRCVASDPSSASRANVSCPIHVYIYMYMYIIYIHVYILPGSNGNRWFHIFLLHTLKFWFVFNIKTYMLACKKCVLVRFTNGNNPIPLYSLKHTHCMVSNMWFHPLHPPWFLADVEYERGRFLVIAGEL